MFHRPRHGAVAGRRLPEARPAELPTVARVSVESPQGVDVPYDAATKALMNNYLPPDREGATAQYNGRTLSGSVTG